MTVAIENRVKALVEAKIAGREDLFLVGVRMYPNNRLEVLIDGDHGVSIDDCVDISRYIGHCLEEEDAIAQAYRLEVSSPGVDSPLTSIRQYRKNIGRDVKITLHDGGTKTGSLAEVSDDAVTILEKVKEKGKKAVEHRSEIPFAHIKTTKVLISFKLK